MVWCGSWCIVWSVVGILDSSDCLIWCDGLIWGGSYGLRLLSGLTAEIKIKKMRSWGNSSEKALNALGSYVKKKRRKNTKILYFSNSVAIENFLCPEKVCKDFIILIQGCADDLFESFPFVARIATCNVHHHGNNPGSALIYPRERSRVMQWHNIRWESRFDCFGWLVFIRAIGPLQLVIHVVQNRRAGEQKSHWDKTNKENYHLKLCMSFVCLVPMRL